MNIDLNILNYHFLQKPLVVGGMAMEYYALRKAGEDIDLVASHNDIRALIALYPDRLKDIWGDLGVCPYNYEIFKTICLLNYDDLSEGAVDLGEVLMISLEKLLVMKTLGIHKEKYLNDTRLIAKHILDENYKHFNTVKAENNQLLNGVDVTFLMQKGPDSI